MPTLTLVPFCLHATYSAIKVKQLAPHADPVTEGLILTKEDLLNWIVFCFIRLLSAVLTWTLKLILQMPLKCLARKVILILWGIAVSRSLESATTGNWNVGNYKYICSSARHRFFAPAFTPHFLSFAQPNQEENKNVENSSRSILITTDKIIYRAECVFSGAPRAEW